MATNIYVKNSTGKITVGGIELQIKSEKGAANGYASLDSSSKLPVSQLPNINIDDLADVSISSPSSGQVIKFNGTLWTNAADEGTGGGSTGSESVLVSGSALTGTVLVETATYQAFYYTAAATGTWTPNFKSTSAATLDSVLAAGESITVTILATIGPNSYYSSAVQIDGNSVTPKWVGGIAPTTGNANSIDVYSYTIVKTASATFTVLASVAQFA